MLHCSVAFDIFIFAAVFIAQTLELLHSALCAMACAHLASAAAAADASLKLETGWPPVRSSPWGRAEGQPRPPTTDSEGTRPQEPPVQPAVDSALARNARGTTLRLLLQLLALHARPLVAFVFALCRIDACECCRIVAFCESLRLHCVQLKNSFVSFFSAQLPDGPNK